MSIQDMFDEGKWYADEVVQSAIDTSARRKALAAQALQGAFAYEMDLGTDTMTPGQLAGYKAAQAAWAVPS